MVTMWSHDYLNLTPPICKLVTIEMYIHVCAGKLGPIIHVVKDTCINFCARGVSTQLLSVKVGKLR